MNPKETSHLTDVLNKQSQTKQDKLDKNSIKNVKPHEYNSGNQNLAYDFSEDSTEVSNRTTLTQKKQYYTERSSCQQLYETKQWRPC